MVLSTMALLELLVYKKRTSTYSQKLNLALSSNWSMRVGHRIQVAEDAENVREIFGDYIRAGYYKSLPLPICDLGGACVCICMHDSDFVCCRWWGEPARTRAPLCVQKDVQEDRRAHGPL